MDADEWCDLPKSERYRILRENEERLLAMSRDEPVAVVPQVYFEDDPQDVYERLVQRVYLVKDDDGAGPFNPRED